MNVSTTLPALQRRWDRLASREKNLLRLATVLVLGALVWQWLLAPALVTLRTADAQAKALDTQLAQMQAMQAQAQALQKQPVLGFDDTLRALTTATKQTLGTAAQVSVAGERASITVQGVPADALAQWLAQGRLNARSVPLEARLTRSAADPATWSGVLFMSLPAR
ncbi:type II secretion system protein GspM [Polaromonas jejuensis]|uniref:Type II secretion system protein GspM n=1 Tax=Polaromonas jejuensis TaxID=457502 RepID=A0ABW0Q6V7_9BURK|nr:type II secretion system protein GspM [Polaromonas jejuensis]